ncbi:MAG: DUF1330 domain-containing protein [Alphaproteobacteria bacterium]
MIVDLDVHEPEGFARYREGVPALAKKHGGEYLVRGADFDVIEGDWRSHRLVIFHFPDRAAIRALFADPDYDELKALRHRVADSVIIAVDGVD